MVEQAGQDGLSGDHDVPPGPAHEGLDREGHRAAAQRGVYLAEPVQELVGAPEGRAEPRPGD